MKQFYWILMFVGAFALGGLADHWMLSKPGLSPTFESSRNVRSVSTPIEALSAADRTTPKSAMPVPDIPGNFEETRITAVPHDDAAVVPADQHISLVAFEEFAETRQSTASTDAPRVQPSQKVPREQVRSVIAERFPDLPADTVSGWTDAYEDLPLDELELLLEQRRNLPSIFPGSILRSRPHAEIGDLLPTPVNNHAPFAAAAAIVHRNLLHATTPGFRKRRIITQLSSFSGAGNSATDLADFLQQGDNFDFQPGEVHASGNPRHMAIANHPELMFQLEPGNLLTRSGTFVRLADGRLGLQIGDKAAALSAQILIPEHSGALLVSTTGEVHVNDDGGQMQPVGELKLVVITELADLQSANGVFFTTSTDPSMIPTADVTPVVTGALEASNVDIESEWKLADHFARLSGP